jgi:hypothetical protein
MHNLVTVPDYVPVESANGVGVARWRSVSLLLRQVSDKMLQLFKRKAQ